MENKTIIKNPIRKGINESLIDKRFILKSVIIILILAGVALNCVLGFGLASKEVSCIEDVSHVYTENINKYLHENSHVADLITIFSSFCIDIIMLSICINFVMHSQSWRVLMSLLFFYTLRGLTQFLFQMRNPDGLIWNYPGIPSLAVSYLKTTDYFFSGHVGLPVIVACEFFKFNKNKMAYFAIFSCIIEFIVMTIMRGHYIIDLIFGIITAHYIFLMVDKYIYVLDDSSFTLKVGGTSHIEEKRINSSNKESENGDSKGSTTSEEEPLRKSY